jgi:hypothetical protein
VLTVPEQKSWDKDINIKLFLILCDTFQQKDSLVELNHEEKKKSCIENPWSTFCCSSAFFFFFLYLSSQPKQLRSAIQTQGMQIGPESLPLMLH